MTDYKSMYYRLFNRVTNAIELLKAAQVEGEGAFVDSEDGTVLELVKPESDTDDEK